MSKPAIIPETTTAGIAVDPRTLERVIPESRRPDGSVRKQIKIRPGFTPQEDVRRFRGTRQAQLDSTALPKGHIIGWTPPPVSSAPKPGAALSKSAKKNEKRKEKRKEKHEEEVKTKIPNSWEDEDEEQGAPGEGKEESSKGAHKPENPNWAAALEIQTSTTVRQKGKTEPEREAGTDELTDQLRKLEVR